jgi:uncharacterized membrane protein YphA (DoxX/SURF4 family)
MKNFSKYSHLVLRIGIAVVFLWFGFSQLKNPAQWTRMMPDYVNAIFPLAKSTLIYMNGILEILLAILLLLGLWTRTVSGLITLHLIHIITIVGYGAVGARDVAIALAALAVFLHGSDEFCLDEAMKKDRYIPPHQR